MLRDLMKTLSFATLHFGVGFGVTYALTGSVAIATGVALIEPTVNTVVFFFHERVWARFPAKVEIHGGHGYRHGVDQPQRLALIDDVPGRMGHDHLGLLRRFLQQA
ncbi:putative membrane protein [Dongia mobilis]|uniref:Putative membrane protein n=1 Tax=Dongia mobilis TaxID=578943 RepID=A0A4R6WUS0_9PROT|nr:DUF2061 domain-containing protein [Dongia mobilis]TDQ83900.1 putative membrane protein [Dongia mobilis]